MQFWCEQSKQARKVAKWAKTKSKQKNEKKTYLPSLCPPTKKKTYLPNLRPPTQWPPTKTPPTKRLPTKKEASKQKGTEVTESLPKKEGRNHDPKRKVSKQASKQAKQARKQGREALLTPKLHYPKGHKISQDCGGWGAVGLFWNVGAELEIWKYEVMLLILFVGLVKFI